MNSFRLLFACFCCALAGWALAGEENQANRQTSRSLAPLRDAITRGGLEGLAAHLEGSGKWPRITTDSRAEREGIVTQKDLVDLCHQVVGLLKIRVAAAPSEVVGDLEAEVRTLFSLADQFWRADGYRNRVVALVCDELATYRLAKLVILTRGANTGPKRPETLTAKSPTDLRQLLIDTIPESADAAKTGLQQKLAAWQTKETEWIGMQMEMGEIEIEGTTVLQRHHPLVTFRLVELGVIVDNEDVSSLVSHYGFAQGLYEGTLMALANFLRNGGDLKELREHRVDSKTYQTVMKGNAARFNRMPALASKVDEDDLMVLARVCEDGASVSKRFLFAP